MVEGDRLAMVDSEDYNPYRHPPRTFTGATNGTLASVDEEANHPFSVADILIG